MSVAEFKRWHWALIGLALGLIVSLWRGWVGPEGALIDRPTLEAVDFEKLVVQKSATGQPMVRDIRVHSVVDGTYWLTAQQLFRDNRAAGSGPLRERYVAVKIPAKTPFVPKTNPPPQGKTDPNFTIVDWLASMKAKHPEIGFSTRWWAQEPARTPIFALCGMVVLAGFCPRLVHAVYRITPEAAKEIEEQKKKQAEYDLARFGKGKPEAKAEKKGITEEDLKHVRELDQELERRLLAAAGGAPGAEPSPASDAGAAAATNEPGQPLRKLEAGPLEVTVDPNAQKKHKRFGGEFYPTETHVKQDDDDKKNA